MALEFHLIPVTMRELSEEEFYLAAESCRARISPPFNIPNERGKGGMEITQADVPS
jgi:hypothetical protein